MPLVSTISLVMAEASDGKAVLPPSKEGDAKREPDPLDAYSSRVPVGRRKR